ncbi:hypothetical protein C8T65DRAFT_679773 [Cerioporus squamosus]|nr:hypothetical protein C8T65DRAFT_679773 [Cerioporus squamosus]
MGLAGRKTKQRIPNDPRNLAWANDASKFGAAYLAKLGWDPSRGLGVSGEGRTSALSVNQKLDMLGIGADHKNSAEGMAWKQNKDFENLLRRLNAANGNGEAQEEEPMKIDGFVRPTAKVEPENQATADGEIEGAHEDGEKKLKKKRKKGEQEDESKERKKKRKKSKSSEDTSDAEESSKKEKKKKKKRDTEREINTPAETASPSPAPTVPSAGPSRHPRAAYRGRHMAAKSLASKSASAIAEILGLASPSPSPSPAISGYPSSAPTPYPSTPFEPGPSTSTSGSDTPADTEQLKLQELTVSSKSVMDYFKEKLAAKSNARVYGGSSSAPASGTDTPAAAEDDYDYGERPRVGLGASKLRMEVTRAEETVEERRGLGGIGSGMRSSFAAMFTSATVTKTVAEETVVEDSPAAAEVGVEQDEDEDRPKKSSKDKKDKKSKKAKGKEKATVEDETAASVDLAEDASTDEKAERKRRKEEKRRRKEAAAAQASSTAVVDADDTAAASDDEAKERKRKKDKKKSKADR